MGSLIRASRCPDPRRYVHTRTLGEIGIMVQSQSKMVIRSVWQRRAMVLFQSWETWICLGVIAILLLIALVPGAAWSDTATKTNLANRYAQPAIAGYESGNFLGADSLGRDVFLRILSSTRLTLMISGLATLLSTVFGVTSGLLAGYFGGAVDAVTSRIIDIFLAFPTLLLVLALVAAVGQSSWAVIGVLALSGWAGYARVIRSATLQLTQREFIEAARCIGVSDLAIMFRHLLPNIVAPIVVLSTVNLASFILTESAISFLGLGPAPPEITWGGLIGDGRNSIYDAWWISVFPGIAIVITVISLSFIGDAIRDAFDPRTQN